ncbi:MAG: hypothetical protein ACYDEV_12585, partial [Acidiferrobacter sp.]
MAFPLFVALYALAHIFIWRVLVSGLLLSAWAQGGLALVLLVLGTMPFLARRLERRGHVKLARIFAWVGYTWAGLVLLFVMVRLAVDILRDVLALLGVPVAHDLARPLPMVATGIFTTILAAYAFIERSRVRVEHIDVPTEKDLGGLALLRVAQVSDVHIGSMNGRRRVRTMIRRLEESRPDVVVST